MVANNQSIIYDIETNTETPLPEIPNGVHVTNPMDGSAILLPLSPPLYIPEVLVCGGSNFGVALDNCVSIQPEVANPTWTLERMVRLSQSLMRVLR